MNYIADSLCFYRFAQLEFDDRELISAPIESGMQLPVVVIQSKLNVISLLIILL